MNINGVSPNSELGYKRKKGKKGSIKKSTLEIIKTADKVFLLPDAE